VTTPTAQLGLLDLSVDLSVPEVYAGADFTLYLHIKNPFARSVWIQKVELSLPAQLSWVGPPLVGRSKARGTRAGKPLSMAKHWGLRRAIKSRHRQVSRLVEQQQSPKITVATRSIIQQTIDRLMHQIEQAESALGGRIARTEVSAFGDATINVYGGKSDELEIHAANSSTVNVYQDSDEPQRVPLASSLPEGTALEPGCTDVWTIRLGTKRTPFFIPAKYHLQLTVIYALEPPVKEPTGPAAEAPDQPAPSYRRIFSNTTAFTVPIRAALRNIVFGGAIGGIVGSIGRSIQDARTFPVLLHAQLGIALGSLFLAIILSGAGIIFTARKSDAQSFVTVEDFWGALLIGFVIGYSGTAAFSSITGIHT
jgi:hypothetical protein